MAPNPVFSAIVPEVLIEENYETWSVCIQNYLLSQDLWDIIETESTPTENTSEFNWRKKNATALHAIQISCGSKLLHHIKGYESAKEAWGFLAKKCSPQIQEDSVSSSIFKEFSHSEEEWLNSITGAEEKNARTNQSQTYLMRIRKLVPPILPIKKFKTCYEPRVVSIGPYHRNHDPRRARLQQVEELKPLIAKQFVNQLTKIKNVGQCFSQFKEEFEKIKNPCIKDLYDENVTKVIDEEKLKDEFMRMMFLDGCFVLYFIFGIHFFEGERMGLKKHIIALVQQDLFLIENQLPFQVLNMLISLTVFPRNGRYMLEEFAMNTCGWSMTVFPRSAMSMFEMFTIIGMCMLEVLEVFIMYTCGWSSTCGWSRMRYQGVRNEKPLHLLDFVWIKLLGNYEESKNEERLHRNKYHDNKRHLFHGVKELIAAGIHIRPISSCSLRDIKFRSYGIYGMLTLPRMTIESSTRQMFLNLIAYEAYMNNPNKSGFTSYICFLDLLIDHAEDVKALRTAGILENYLDSDEEVANLFNEIASDLLPEVDTFKDVKFKIQRYLGNKRKVKMASWVDEVIRDHFKSPWTIIALLAGIIVISLAFAQTYFTIFPRSK